MTTSVKREYITISASRRTTSERAYIKAEISWWIFCTDLMNNIFVIGKQIIFFVLIFGEDLKKCKNKFNWEIGIFESFVGKIIGLFAERTK